MSSRIVGSYLIGGTAVVLIALFSARPSDAGLASLPATDVATHATSMQAKDVNPSAPAFAPGGDPSLTTCSRGFWTCPDNGAIFKYTGSPGCFDTCVIFQTQAQAFTNCSSHCTGICFESEWFEC